MSSEISDDACMKVALNSFSIGIDKPNGTNLGCVAFLETDTGRLTNRFFTASEALAAQAEIDRAQEISDTEIEAAAEAYNYCPHLPLDRMHHTERMKEALKAARNAKTR